MSEAKRTAPDFTVQVEVRMDAALGMRDQLRGVLANNQIPSVTDLIVKASAIALRRHPKANGSFIDDHLELHERINVGIAVAASDVLLVPTIYDPDSKSLGAIASETRRLVENARAGALTAAELDGGTFTISNLGMYGVSAVTPILFVPQAAILGVGAIREVLRLVDGQPAHVGAREWASARGHDSAYRQENGSP